MTMYCWYQTESKSVWHPALASERANIMRNKKPALMTCLDADNDFTADLSMEEMQSVKYVGDFYADFDSESIPVAIEQFKKFLTLLKSKDVNLDQLRLQATGGRGFHLHIPMAMFMPKIPPAGVQGLPHIYKEMAYALYVDDLDLRTYSGKRGRQFRCVNIQRESGTYKVSISASEALSMTEELYTQLCSAPRNELPVEPPDFNADLGLLYSSSKDKIEKAIVKRKAKKPATNQLAKFQGRWPDTMELVFNGVGLKPDVGWNFVSLQLSILASELGKSEDELLEAADVLINSHTGDSSRYNTAAKRKDDLRTMFRYVNGSPLYEYTPGGIMALLIPEVRANADVASGDWVPDERPKPEPIKQVQEDGTIIEIVPEVEVLTDDPTAPIRVSRGGIFVRTDTGYATACALGLDNITLLKRMDETAIGYEVEVFKGSKSKGKHILPMDRLGTKAAFQAWSFTWSASMGASDAQTSKLADILCNRAERNKDVVYIVSREGVDLVLKRGEKEEDALELIWSCPDKVIASRGGNYRFRSHAGSAPAYRSDLMNAPDLTIEDGELIEHLLSVNTANNMGKLLGWFCAAFMCQIFRRYYRKFPSLQCFGQAGAGKSETTRLLNHLHYYMETPKSLETQSQTPHPLRVAVGASCSQPVLFDEMKGRDLSKPFRSFLLGLFRSNYDGHTIQRGGLSRDTANKEVVVIEFDNTAPIAFIGEAIEDQSALLERCIIVALSKQDKFGKSDHFHYVAARAPELGKLGKALVTNVLAIDIPKMRAEFDEVFARVRKEIGVNVENVERPAFNRAVVVFGLQLLQSTLQQVFGDKFDGRLTEMQESLLSNVVADMPSNLSEASRVLDVMAQLSRNPDSQYQIVRGADYTMGTDGTMDLKLRTAFAKYVRWERSLGREVLFDSESAFITGMMSYGGTVSKVCLDNMQLCDSPKAVVFRLSLEYLEKENVDMFR